MDSLYQCQECHRVFRRTEGTAVEIHACPACNSHQIKELPAWVPLGTNIGEGTAQWEYQCHECKHTFKRPVPASPTEEQAIVCPACGGRHIHRLTIIDGAPLYCG